MEIAHVDFNVITKAIRSIANIPKIYVFRDVRATLQKELKIEDLSDQEIVDLARCIFDMQTPVESTPNLELLINVIKSLEDIGVLKNKNRYSWSWSWSE